jgi:hypothetical protein
MESNHDEHDHEHAAANNEGSQIPEDSESQEESQIHNENLQSRFYRKDFPDENDIVLVSFEHLRVFLLPPNNSLTKEFTFFL